jgi:glucokinase
MNGKECTCGNKGCVETLCSAAWIADKGGQDAKKVIDSAKEGDPVSVRIFGEYIENLSSAIASLAAVFDPQIIAIGGGISLAGDFLFEPLRKKVENKSFFKHPYKIVPAKLGNEAGMVGAAISSGLLGENGR